MHAFVEDIFSDNRLRQICGADHGYLLARMTMPDFDVYGSACAEKHIHPFLLPEFIWDGIHRSQSNVGT